MNAVGVEIFKDSAEQEVYLAKRITEAKKEICDLTWKEKLSLSSALPKRVRTHKTYESSIARAAKKVPYREVFTFSDDRRIEKLKRRLAEKLPGYSCRYFPSPCEIPRLQFVLIDHEEVVFASSSYPFLCAIRQPELCAVFSEYFETIWSVAVPLKDGDVIHQDEVDKVLPK